MEKLGFIGGGNMAEALIKGIINANIFTPDNIYVSDINAERLKCLADTYCINTLEDNKELIAKADIVVFSVEPQQMADMLEGIKDVSRDDKLFITIAAGKQISFYKNILGDIKLIRVMPNTPSLIACGVCGIYAPENANDKIDKVVKIFDSVGSAVILDSEDLIDAIIAASGSGPAYFFKLMEHMIEKAQQLGLDEKTASKVVINTAKGAALLADASFDSGLTPAMLREKIVSRGGTTEAALNTFKNGNLGPLVDDAMQNAYDRAKQLASDRN